REPDIADADRAEAALYLRSGRVARAHHRLVQLGEALLRDRGEERLLVGKVMVGRGLRDAHAPSDLAQRQGARPLPLDDRERRFDEAPAEIAVVVAVLRGGGGGGAAHTSSLSRHL